MSNSRDVERRYAKTKLQVCTKIILEEEGACKLIRSNKSKGKLRNIRTIVLHLTNRINFRAGEESLTQFKAKSTIWLLETAELSSQVIRKLAIEECESQKGSFVWIRKLRLVGREDRSTERSTKRHRFNFLRPTARQIRKPVENKNYAESSERMDPSKFDASKKKKKKTPAAITFPKFLVNETNRITKKPNTQGVE